MLKITKFGGSSTANSEQFKKIKKIIEADEGRKFVCVSASGRRFKDDNKVTDLLCLVVAHRDYHVDYSALLDDIESRYLEIKNTLGLKYPVEEKFDLLRQTIPTDSAPYIISRGEWLTAHLMAEYLGYEYLDAAEAIIFHHDGTLNLEATNEAIREVVKKYDHFVMPGFYGGTTDGHIKLLDRGGGDITGSLMASALDADLYENWTDVSGFLSADPSIVENPRTIKKITFDEMQELSYMGASVLHEEAIFPVREKNIPIQIKNTNEPEAEGTIIRELWEPDPTDPLVTGIAGKKDFLSVYITKTKLANSVGFLRSVLSTFEKYGVSIEHIPTGIDSFSVVVNAKDVKDSIYSIVADIKKELEPDKIEINENLALISVVGRNMPSKIGTSGKLLGVVGDAKINVRMISQSSQERTIVIGVENRDFERCVQVIYDAFVNETSSE